MTANKSFHMGDSIVLEWWPIDHDTKAAITPYSMRVQITTPITSIVWDPEADGGNGAYIITGGTQYEYGTHGDSEIYLKDDDHYGIVYVPDEPGWHRWIMAGWESQGVKLYSRMGTFYVQATTLDTA